MQCTQWSIHARQLVFIHRRGPGMRAILGVCPANHTPHATWPSKASSCSQPMTPAPVCLHGPLLAQQPSSRRLQASIAAMVPTAATSHTSQPPTNQADAASQPAAYDQDSSMEQVSVSPASTASTTAAASTSHHQDTLQPSGTDGTLGAAGLGCSKPPTASRQQLLDLSEQQTLADQGSDADVLFDGTSSGTSTAEGASSRDSPGPEGLSKAAARKARRTAPSIIPPPSLPHALGDQLSAAFSNGALLVDKPLGWTSFDVCGKLRNSLKFLSVKKVGHAGTLDPMATGLLVVATGAGTKFIDDFVAMEKEYSGVIRLGEGTATYDAEGEVNERMEWEHITDEDIQRAAATFVGDIMQVPPMYSAIKMGGQKLYDLAREGTTVERVPRAVTISSFKVWRATDTDHTSSTDELQPELTQAIEQDSTASQPASTTPDLASSGTDGNQPELPLPVRQDSVASQLVPPPSTQGAWANLQASGVIAGAPRAASRQDLHFHVRCSKGTYVRSLAWDLGRALGSVAHLTALRRESIGPLHVRDAWQLTDLLNALQASRVELGLPPLPPRRPKQQRKEKTPAKEAGTEATEEPGPSA